MEKRNVGTQRNDDFKLLVEYERICTANISSNENSNTENIYRNDKPRKEIITTAEIKADQLRLWGRSARPLQNIMKRLPYNSEIQRSSTGGA